MTPRQIYVVDDNHEFRDSLRFWLEGFGCQVRDWGDPRDALQSLARVAVGTAWPESTCLMLDVRMPELSGLDLHDALRERGIHLPVIYMSGHADVPLAVAAMQKRGAISLLEKPLDDAALSAALDRAFAPMDVDLDVDPASRARARSSSAARRRCRRASARCCRWWSRA
jgi:FixJ family two-component response regulator